MNKKIIAIAVAGALTAPMMAQAETKISGRVAQDIVSGPDSVGMADSGQARLQFDYKDEDSSFFGRLALDGREGKVGTHRDIYVGMKAGPGKLAFGRMAGVTKNLEKDPFIATFLQMRGAAVAGGSYGSSSFIDDVVTYKMDLGGAKLAVQMSPISDDADVNVGGYVGLAVTGGAKDGLQYYVGYNNGDSDTVETPDNAYTKAGIRMPLGGMKLRVGMDSQGSQTGDAKDAKIHVGVNMKMGGGMLDVTFATGGKAVDTNGDDIAYTRLAYKIKHSKKVSSHMGAVVNGGAAPDDTAIGYGVTVKF